MRLIGPCVYSLCCQRGATAKSRFPNFQIGLADLSLAVCWSALHTAMPHLSADVKHHILLEYSPHDTARSFAALARRHAVKGGERVVRRWHARWDGSPASLERRPGTGRARVLSRAQVQRHIATPIRAANRAHRAIHSPDLLPRVRAATGTQVSLRTVQHYGEEELRAKQKHGVKRTAEESKPRSTSGSVMGCALQSCELTSSCSGSCPV